MSEEEENQKETEPLRVIDFDSQLQYRPQPRRLSAEERREFVDWLIDNNNKYLHLDNYKSLAKESVHDYRELTGKQIPMTWIYTMLRCGLNRDAEGNITFRRTDFTIYDFCRKPSIAAQIRITE